MASKQHGFYRRVAIANCVAAGLVIFTVFMATVSVGSYRYMQSYCPEHPRVMCRGMNSDRYLANAVFYATMTVVFAGAGMALNLAVARKGEALMHKTPAKRTRKGK